MTNKSALYEIDLDQATWRKASASAGQGECVELTDLPDGAVAVRDSKNLGWRLCGSRPANGQRFVKDC